MTEPKATFQPILHIPGIHFKDGYKTFYINNSVYPDFERGLKRLANRSLLMAGPEDTIILNEYPDPEYLAFLTKCGVGGGAVIVPKSNNNKSLCEDILDSDDCLDFIKKWNGPIETYMYTELEQKLKDITGTKRLRGSAPTTELLNDKLFFFRLTEDLGLPQPKTVTGPQESIAIKAMTWEGGGPIIIKGATSIGGSRIWVARDGTERLKASREVEQHLNQMFLMQTLEKVDYSPNLQYHICDTEFCLVGRSLQLLDGGVRHNGNLFDSIEDSTISDEIDRQGREVAIEVAEMGYRGLLGIDFIVTNVGEVYAVELNARHNSSTHALWFCNRVINNDPLAMIPSGLGAYIRLKTDKSMAAMKWIKELGDIAYDPDRKKGVLPYDCQGEDFEAAIIGSTMKERNKIMEDLKSVV